MGELVDRRATRALGASSRLLDVDEEVALEDVLALFVLLASFVGSVLSCQSASPLMKGECDFAAYIFPS